MRLRYSPCSRVVRSVPLVLLALFIGLVLWAGFASASCTSASMCIPPVSGCAYTGTCEVLYPTGFEIRNLTLYDFTSCVNVLPGQTNSASLECKMDVDLSPDAGSTWNSYLAIPTTCHMIFSWSGTGSQGEDLYTGTIDDLSAAGGSLPFNLRFRESPFQNSTGPASVRAETGGYQIESFFDVFTELSLDGGMTWYPGFSACRIVLNPTGPTPVKPSTWGKVKVLYR
jgi:hypothetical protein